MTAPNDRPPQDLGFGRVVAQASRGRLLNRDGTFNIRRTGLGFFESWSAYHWLMGLSWPRFLLVLATGVVQRLRDEKKFEGVDALKTQIDADRTRTHDLFSRMGL